MSAASYGKLRSVMQGLRIMKLRGYARNGLNTLFLCVLGWTLGCTALPGDNVFTIKQTDLNVHWKMTQYNAVGPFGGVTTTQAQEVEAAYKAYQEALDQALKEAHGNRDAPTPPYLQQKADRVIQAVTSVLSTLTSNFTGPVHAGTTASRGSNREFFNRS